MSEIEQQIAENAQRAAEAAAAEQARSATAGQAAGKFAMEAAHVAVA